MLANNLNLPSYRVTALQSNERDYHIDAVRKIVPNAALIARLDKLLGFGRYQLIFKLLSGIADKSLIL
jgi:hypothetical protein